MSGDRIFHVPIVRAGLATLGLGFVSKNKDRSAIVPYSDPPSEASPGAPPLPPSMTPTSGAPQVPPRYRRSESKDDEKTTSQTYSSVSVMNNERIPFSDITQMSSRSQQGKYIILRSEDKNRNCPVHGEKDNKSVTSTKVEMRFGLNPWRKASEETSDARHVEPLRAPSLIKTSASKSSLELESGGRFRPRHSNPPRTNLRDSKSTENPGTSSSDDQTISTQAGLSFNRQRSSSFAADKCSSYNPLRSSRSSSISDLSSTNANNKTVVKIDKDGTHNSTREKKHALTRTTGRFSLRAKKGTEGANFLAPTFASLTRSLSSGLNLRAKSDSLKKFSSTTNINKQERKTSGQSRSTRKTSEPARTPSYPSVTPRKTSEPTRTPSYPTVTPRKTSEPTRTPSYPSVTPRKTSAPALSNRRTSELPRTPSYPPVNNRKTSEPTRTPSYPSVTPRKTSAPTRTPSYPSLTPRITSLPPSHPPPAWSMVGERGMFPSSLPHVARKVSSTSSLPSSSIINPNNGYRKVSSTSSLPSHNEYKKNIISTFPYSTSDTSSGTPVTSSSALFSNPMYRLDLDNSNEELLTPPESARDPFQSRAWPYSSILRTPGKRASSMKHVEFLDNLSECEYVAREF